jgi:hypothetical protein
MPNSDRTKIDDVLMLLHEHTMDSTASEFELTLARLRKAAIPGVLEFLHGELQREQKLPVNELIAAMLIFFGEFAAKIVVSYSSLPADDAWAIARIAIEQSFLSVYEQCSNANETQSGETDHPTLGAESSDHG